MNQKITLVITSLLSILFFSLHWADELARGMEPGTNAALGGLAIVFVWMYAALVLIERPVGLIILLLGSLLAAGVPVLHMQGGGLLGGRITVDSSGAFFWVWTMIAMSATGTISVALSVHRLWSMRQTKSRA